MSDHLGERWQRFSWFGIDPVVGKSGSRCVKEHNPSAPDVSEVLNHLEAILIAAAEPTLNRQGGKFGNAEQFFQSWQDDDDDEVLEEVQSLHKKLDEIASKLKKL
jgi:hypothetical protein